MLLEDSGTPCLLSKEDTLKKKNIQLVLFSVMIDCHGATNWLKTKSSNSWQNDSIMKHQSTTLC